MYARVMGLIFRLHFECPFNDQIPTGAHLYTLFNMSYPPPGLVECPHQTPKILRVLHQH